MWDNIHGPKVLQVWSGDEGGKGVLLPSRMDRGGGRMEESGDDLALCDSLTDTGMVNVDILRCTRSV